jgi:DUF1365 family protein
MTSALYIGSVFHKRWRPHVHTLIYRVFWTLLDLDDIDQLDATLPLFARNRFHLISFYDRDHLDGSGTPLRTQIEQHLANAGLHARHWSVAVLTMPRILGYVFNPLSLWFCRDDTGALRAILYEVSNTFGERHCYLIDVKNPSAALIEQSCAKVFYVSPFLDMKMTYDFCVKPPSDDVMVTITTRDNEGIMLTASLDAQRHPLTARTILGAVLTFPLLTLKVIAAIHWEALFIWLKGALYYPRPQPPATPLTHISSEAKDAS